MKIIDVFRSERKSQYATQYPASPKLVITPFDETKLLLPLGVTKYRVRFRAGKVAKLFFVRDGKLEQWVLSEVPRSDWIIPLIRQHSNWRREDGTLVHP